MFELNEKVVDKSGRIFTIVDEESANFGGGEGKYFVLKPCFEYDFSPGYQCFVPVDKADNLLRKTINADEALALIDKYNSLEIYISRNPREKKLCFQQVLSSGVLIDILKVYKTLLCSKQERLKNNKPFSDFDSRLLKNLKILFVYEFSIALSIPSDQIASFISTRIGTDVF